MESGTPEGGTTECYGCSEDRFRKKEGGEKMNFYCLKQSLSCPTDLVGKPDCENCPEYKCENCGRTKTKACLNCPKIEEYDEETDWI